MGADLSRDPGEVFIRDVIKALKICSYSYDSLLLFIDEKIEDIELTKEYIWEDIFPYFYETNEELNMYHKYHQRLFFDILDNISSSPTKYEIVFYVYPFIEHVNENTVEHFYDIIYQFNYKVMQHSKVCLLVKNYMELCTLTLSASINKEMEMNNPIKQNIMKLVHSVYSNKNILKEMNYFLGNIHWHPKNGTILTQEEFEKHFNENNILFANYFQIRDRFLFKFG